MRVYHWAAVVTTVVLLAASAAAKSYYTNSTDTNDLSIYSKNDLPALIREGEFRQALGPSTITRDATIKYDSWVLVCRFSAGRAAKKKCIARLRAAAKDKRGTLLVWEIGVDKEGHFVTTFHVPPAIRFWQDGKVKRGPLLIKGGIELKFGNGSPRHINYVWCGPKQCSAEALIDDTFVKAATTSMNATITLRTANGGVVPIEISIKGIDKVISATRK